jgi:hypothetical protein
MGPVVCPETSATTYQFTLRNISEELRSHLASRIRSITVCRDVLTNIAGAPQENKRGSILVILAAVSPVMMLSLKNVIKVLSDT